LSLQSPWRNVDPITIFDLLFLALMASVIVATVRILYLSIRGRFRPARITFIRMLLFAGAYMLVLVGFSLAEPQKQIPIGAAQCFDDWCITVENASRQSAIGATRAHALSALQRFA
jgi:hypothetical protein